MPLDQETEDLIKEVYKNYNYPGPETLIKLVKVAHPDITRRMVQEFLSKDVGTQLTKVQKQKSPGGHITALSPNESWQFDIYDLSRYESKNDGYKYVFACVDVFTRKAYVEPMMKKDSQACEAALKTILTKNKVRPKSMLGDQDSAFLQGPFEAYTDKEGIAVSTNALKDHHALGIIDNYAKRLKSGLTKIFLRQKNTKWIDIIQKFVEVENNKKTRALNDVAPVDAEKGENKEAILKLNMEKNTHNNTVSDLKEDDLVRKTTQKSDIAKGTDPRWSDEVFKVIGTHGMTILLNDGTHLKRTDLLKVPPNTEFTEKNPIRAQKEENRKTRDKLNQEKDEAYKEKKGKDKPVINVVPIGPPPAPVEKPKPGARTKEYFAALRAAHGTQPPKK